MKWQVINGNNIDVLKTYPDNHFDSVVTDPPYGISFLGKDWDSKKATETTSKLVGLQNLPSGMKHTSLADDLEFQYWMRDVFSECLRVLKPGGYLLAFSAARTYHHMAMAAQTAGFEVRDQLMWLYGSGFPKAQDLGKMADSRILKGNASTRSQRQMAMGDDYTEVGHYTVHSGDKESKLAQASKDNSKGTNWTPQTPEGERLAGWKTALKPAHEPIVMARKPFKGSTIDNVLEHGVGALNIDATRIPATDKAKFPEGEYTTDTTVGSIRPETRTADVDETSRYPSNVLGEIPEYQKFFYCPKVSRRERMEGNNHPTVKPVELMKYLIKLVTPAGGRVLDPFNGSGSTGMAAVELGYEYVGCELDPNYVEIANKRIAAWEKQHDTPANNLFEDNF